MKIMLKDLYSTKLLVSIEVSYVQERLANLCEDYGNQNEGLQGVSRSGV